MKEGTVVLVGVMPNPWPPAHRIVIQRLELQGASIELAVDEAGRFEVQAGLERRFLSQPVSLAGGSQVHIFLSWSSAALRLEVNEHQLQPDAPGAPVQKVASKAAPIEGPRTILFPDLDPSGYAEELDRFFAETVRDIDVRAVEGTPYEKVRAAGLLRQLLLDGPSSLVDQVNRRYRSRLRFTIIDSRQVPPANPLYHWRSLDPTSLPNAATVEVSRDQLLAAPVLDFNGMTASVLDVIRVCANAMGGVHLRAPDGAAQSGLLDWDTAVRLLGERPSLAALVGICTIVLRGMKPVVAALKQIDPA